VSRGMSLRIKSSSIRPLIVRARLTAPGAGDGVFSVGEYDEMAAQF
jgi:hypothetical protein